MSGFLVDGIVRAIFVSHESNQISLLIGEFFIALMYNEKILNGGVMRTIFYILGISIILFESTSPLLSYAEDLQKQVDKNGRTVWVNTGQTQEEVVEKKVSAVLSQAKTTAKDILERHPELATDDRLIKTFNQRRDKFISQGLDPARAMSLAEEAMQDEGYFLRQKRQASPTVDYSQKSETQSSSGDLSKLISLEKGRIAQKLEARKEECERQEKHYVDQERCKDRASDSTKDTLEKLNNNPELYFYTLERRAKDNGSSSVSAEDGNHKKRKTRFAETTSGIPAASGTYSANGNIINSSNGDTLNRAAGGYFGNDGTFYTDAAGGIINTKTGVFSPVH